MSYQNENFGMMDEGYFVPRGQILSWLNTLLNLNLSKIQQLGSGAVYCQVVDVIHPGKVAMNKVNWKARNDYEFINNLKVLQNAFDKIGIKRHVQVEKLAKAKYQDNLEFIQWLKRYYDLNCGQRGNNYNPQERRGKANVDFGFAEKTVVPKTYNAGGVVRNSGTTGMEKKKTPTAKHEEAAKRVKSPVVPKKVEVKRPTTTATTKRMGNTGSDFATNTSEIKHEEPKEEGKGDSALLQALEDASEQLEAMKQEMSVYKEKAKQAQMKVQMIKQILKSEDDAQLKVSLIEEITKD